MSILVGRCTAVFAGLIWIALAALGAYPAVHIPDPNLEAALREALDKPAGTSPPPTSRV